jgi:hypothetical protein
MKQRWTARARFAAAAATLAWSMAAAAAEASPTAGRVEELLARMTLEEKVGQLNQLSGTFGPAGSGRC